MKAIVTVIGKDRVGIIADVSRILAERGVNVLDISQTVLQEYFTMIMLVDASRLHAYPLPSSRRCCGARARSLGLRSGLSARTSSTPCTRYKSGGLVDLGYAAPPR